MKKVIRLALLGMVLFGALQAGFADGGPAPTCGPSDPSCTPNPR